ncbi:MAG TPA: class A beta-lactamase [Alphaproteobacteria bacterium]
MKKYLIVSALALSLVASFAVACPIPPHMAPLVATFEKIIAKHQGRVGVCIQDGDDLACVKGHEIFSLQSTTKLLTAMAVMDQVDQKKLTISDKITIHKKDLSVSIQPIAEKVGKDGYTTTIGDLVKRAVVDSDSTANDVLVAKIGGPQAVQSFLNRKEIEHINVNRDERHLQSETIGLTWIPEFADPIIFSKAIKSVPVEKRDMAYRIYQTDTRDTAMPRAMGILLDRFAKGDLLSETSTDYLLNIMRETKTGPNRLKAGLPQGWTLAHKTGTSGTWKNVTAATNDIGIITTPDGKNIAIAVFVGDSTESEAAREKIIADLARATAEFYSKKH